MRCVPVVVALSAGCGGTTKPQSVEPTPTTDGRDDEPSCEPGRCIEDISRAIAEHRRDARACYDEGRERVPTLAGKLIINFAIDAEGVVGETSQGMQDNQITDQGVFECVSGVIRNVRFARSATGKTTRAYHRFEFSPDAR